MSFQWDVQPYQFLDDLRREYTAALVLGTRKNAKQIAAQATVWMKDKAPWKDTDVVRGGKIIYPAGTARAGLHAFVQNSPDEDENYLAAMAEARNTDALLRDELNELAKERRQSARRKVSELTQAGDTSAANRLRRNLRTQKQYKRVRTVPKGKSAVEALKKRKAGFYSPIVTIKFTHNKDLPYAIWLEIANNGRYGIISRAVEYWSPRLMADIKRIATLKQYRDTIALGDVQTQQDVFQEHVRGYEFEYQRPYEPWGAERKARRESRKKYYDPERSRGQRREKQEYLARYGQKRTVSQPTVQTMRINTQNRRATRR